MFASFVVAMDELWGSRLIRSDDHGTKYSVDMARCGFTDAMMPQWCKWFKVSFPSKRQGRDNRVVVVVDFSNNQLTELGASYLCSALAMLFDPSMVIQLELHHNDIGGNGQFMADYIESCSGRLWRLGLTHNKFSASAVGRIITMVVELKISGTHAYPMDVNGCSTPMWLRIHDNQYDSKDLEYHLRSNFARIERPFESTMCVQLWGGSPLSERGCVPRKCGRLSPPPALQVSTLFTHWTSQIPSPLREAKHAEEANWLDFIKPSSEHAHGQFNINMKGKGLTDSDMQRWCKWFIQHQRDLVRKSTKVTIHEVDVSHNHRLTNLGLVTLIKCLVRCKIKVGIIRYTNDRREDASYTIVGTGVVHPRQICPLRTRGCICGGNCHAQVSQDVLERHWSQRVKLVASGSIEMSDEGIDDVSMKVWCLWLKSHYAKMYAPTGDIWLDEADLSNNHLTSVGINDFLTALKDLNIFVETLTLHHNQLKDAEPIVQYLQWSLGSLRRLHLTSNLLDTPEIRSIILAVVNLRWSVSDQTFCYPVEECKPFWLRVEQNPYVSEDLEDELRKAITRIRPPFEKALCVVTHTGHCHPHLCQQITPPPPVHATYLFSHWAKCAVPASGVRVGTQPSSFRSWKAKDLDVNKALHDLRSLLHDGNCQQFFSQNRPIDSSSPLSRAEMTQAETTSTSCRGFVRPTVDSDLGKALLSIASAPALSRKVCFLPDTQFRRADTDSFVTASRLSKGDRLRSPNGAAAVVKRVCMHRSELRTLIRIRITSSAGAVVLTSDHRLPIVMDKVQKPMPAEQVYRSWIAGTDLAITDGENEYKLSEVSLHQEEAEVTEVIFESDDIALVWIRSRRRHRSASVPVYGSAHNQEGSLQEAGFSVRFTFLGVQGQGNPSMSATRSRSAGSRSSPNSSWSVGSEKHGANCKPCRWHMRFLKAGCVGVPCQSGAACNFCHHSSH